MRSAAKVTGLPGLKTPSPALIAFARREREYENPIFIESNPYVGVVTAHDRRVHPNHFAWDFRNLKLVFRYDDPVWKLIRPGLLGRKCRCSKLSFSPEQIKARGLKVGNGMDWYGRVVSVTVPGRDPVMIAMLPDRLLPKKGRAVK